MLHVLSAEEVEVDGDHATLRLWAHSQPEAPAGRPRFRRGFPLPFSVEVDLDLVDGAWQLGDGVRITGDLRTALDALGIERLDAAISREIRWLATVGDLPMPMRRISQRGTVGRDPLWVARFVERYLSAVEEGRGSASQFAETEGYTPQGVSRILRRAEGLGLLTGRPGRGKAGGTMTDECRRLLAERG